MAVRITLIIVSLGSLLVAGRRMSQSHLTKPLQVGDKVVISGVGYEKRRGAIRFYDDHLTCHGRSRAVNGLVLVLQSRRGQLKIGTKTERTNCRDGGFTLPRYAPEIRHNHQYVITVSVIARGFIIRIGDGQHDRVIYKTKNSIGSIDWIRATSGNFSSIIVKRRVTLPLVSHCGVRYSRLAEAIASRFEVNLDAVPGDYPWQVAIRKKHVFVWSPVKHFCGATLISSCWVLTAAHCTRRMRGREDDFYVRVGDFNNNDNSQAQDGEEQEDLSIEKVFIHNQYDESSSDAPVNDISLIKLNGTNGQCATFSVYVNPACLPVPGSDNFTASNSCEISGWGAQSYHQSQSDFPNILQRGTVSLYGFEHCRRLYGRGQNSHEYRVQEGMLCAGGDVDACQGDSGGPLACQRDTTYKLSPFVLWGITSWGEGCALQNRPGVYTDVSLYIPWILDTVSSNSD